MEMLFYLFGNWCCSAAALFLIYHQSTLHRKPFESAKPELLISRDLQIMLFIGTLLRVYWSLSPPAVWTDESLIIQWISFADVLVSPLVWLLSLSPTHGVQFRPETLEKRTKQTPVHCRWPFLTFIAFFVGFVGSRWLPALESPESWYYADSIVMVNMFLDGLAMIPQMYLISSTEEALTPEASHFVGLLSLGRVLRMTFWGIISAGLWWRGEAQASYLWTFIVPDVIHTAIMGDYLYIWMKKVKLDRIDPYIRLDPYGAIDI